MEDNSVQDVFKRSVAAGVSGGVLFQSVSVYFLLKFPDAQNALGLLFSPIWSALFGSSLGVAVWSYPVADTDGNRSKYGQSAPGAIGMAATLLWFVSEEWQANGGFAALAAFSAVVVPTWLIWHLSVRRNFVDDID